MEILLVKLRKSLETVLRAGIGGWGGESKFDFRRVMFVD